MVGETLGYSDHNMIMFTLEHNERDNKQKDPNFVKGNFIKIGNLIGSVN